MINHAQQSIIGRRIEHVGRSKLIQMIDLTEPDVKLHEMNLTH